MTPDGPKYIYTGAVVRVVDGDTYIIEVDLGLEVYARVPIRLLGLDCPELSTLEGQQAKIFVSDLFAKNAMVLLETFKTSEGRDKQTFARWLARVWLADGRSLAEVLRAAGYEKKVP